VLLVPRADVQDKGMSIDLIYSNICTSNLGRRRMQVKKNMHAASRTRDPGLSSCSHSHLDCSNPDIRKEYVSTSCT